MVPATAAEHFGDEEHDYSDVLQYLYRDYHKDIRSTGNFNLACDLEFNEWFSASMTLACSSFSMDRFDGRSGDRIGTAKGTALYIVPFARLCYWRNESMRVYGTLGAGYCIYSGFETRHGTGVFQFNPAGIEYGKKFFAYAELGFGTMFIGGHIGVGYKF